MKLGCEEGFLGMLVGMRFVWILRGEMIVVCGLGFEGDMRYVSSKELRNKINV